MGPTQVTVSLQSLTGDGQAYEALFLADSGATDCLAPAGELRRRGVPEEGRRAYELA